MSSSPTPANDSSNTTIAAESPKHLVLQRLRHLRRSGRGSTRLSVNPSNCKTGVYHWPRSRRSDESNNLHYTDVPNRRFCLGVQSAALNSHSSPISVPPGLRRYWHVDNSGCERKEREQIRRRSRPSGTRGVKGKHGSLPYRFHAVLCFVVRPFLAGFVCRGYCTYVSRRVHSGSSRDRGASRVRRNFPRVGRCVLF